MRGCREIAHEFARREEAMVMTSDAVRHELARIEALIEVLRNIPIADADFEDLNWLKEQWAYLGALLGHVRQGGVNRSGV
jgi:hypothetical protein